MLANTPENTSPVAKIDSHICLLSYKSLEYSEKSYKKFRVKLQYSKKLVLREEPIKGRKKYQKQLPSLYHRMKYLQHFDLTSYFEKSSNILYKKMRRLRSVKINLRKDAMWIKDIEVPPIFRYLARLNLMKLEVEASLADSECKLLESVLKSLIQGLERMINLKTLSLNLLTRYEMLSTFSTKNKNRPESHSDDFLTKRIYSSFKRLNKIENLSVVFKEARSSMLAGFNQRFDHLPRLTTLKISSDSPALGKTIIDNLCGMKSLTAITFSRSFEPNDIISLAVKTPSLKSITIDNHWVVDKTEMPVLKDIKQGQISVVQLHLDVPINTFIEQDSRFIAKFLGPFTKIKSLRLSLRFGGEESMLDLIAKQVNKLTELQDMHIGLRLQTGSILGQFLSQIYKLSQLKKVSLLLQTTSQKGWDPNIQEIHQAIRNFLFQSKDLTEIDLGWDKFSLQCAESVKLIMKEMHDLDKFHLRYRPVALEHGKTHDKILKILTQTFQKVTAKLEDVAIVSSCFPKGPKNDCNRKESKFAKDIAQNTNITGFYPIYSKFLIPFYQDILDH